MPTENKKSEPSFDLNTPDGGRGYIDHLFKTVLKRHDYRQYIAERLAGDFACTLAQHFERITAERDALQLRLNAADELLDHAVTALNEIVRASPMGEKPFEIATLAIGEMSAMVEQPAPAMVLPELTDELRYILGMMCFQCITYAQALRGMGHTIANKAEDEQAATIHWMFGHYMIDPVNWRTNAIAEIKAAKVLAE
jgi:hypothetical protein